MVAEPSGYVSTPASVDGALVVCPPALDVSRWCVLRPGNLEIPDGVIGMVHGIPTGFAATCRLGSNKELQHCNMHETIRHIRHSQSWSVGDSGTSASMLFRMHPLCFSSLAHPANTCHGRLAFPSALSLSVFRLLLQPCFFCFFLGGGGAVDMYISAWRMCRLY